MYTAERQQHCAAVASLQPHPFSAQHYGDCDPSYFIELKASISTRGILSSLIVAADGKTVVSGHRRLRAAVELGMTHVPITVLVGLSDDLDIREAIVLANISRPRDNESRARDYTALLDIEKERASRRRGVPGATEGRATDIAAKKVGWSQKTADKAKAVVAAVDKATREGNVVVASEIRNSLNKSVTQGAKAAAAAQSPASPASAVHGTCPMGGDHVYDDDACSKCHAPKDDTPHPCLIHMAEWNDAIDAFCRRIAPLAGSLPQGPWMPADRQEIIRTALANVASTARLARGSMLCPGCSGSGCRACKTTGFVPKQVGDLIKPRATNGARPPAD